MASASKKGIAAMLFATGLALTNGMPSYAADAVPASETVPQTATAQTATVAQKTEPAQTQALVVDGESDATTETRDSFTVTLPPPVRAGFASLSYINLSTSAVQWPFASSPISSDFGGRTAPCRGCSSFHNGVDFTPGAGTPIASMAAGVVREVNHSSSGLGTHVIIDHQIDGQLVSSVYGHMQAGSAAVVPGQTVAVGALVGLVGNTGASTGAHLHFEVHVQGAPTDPFAWLVANVR